MNVNKTTHDQCQCAGCAGKKIAIIQNEKTETIPTLERVLKDKDDPARLTVGDKWLVWDNIEGMWVVYQRRPYQEYTRILIKTKHIERAVELF